MHSRTNQRVERTSHVLSSSILRPSSSSKIQRIRHKGMNSVTIASFSIPDAKIEFWRFFSQSGRPTYPVMKTPHPILPWFLSAMLAFMTPMLDGCNKSGETGSRATNSKDAAPATTYARPAPDELYQLVAPIALFPDNLVAQVLAGSTYPDQVAAANTWLKQNTKLKGNDLMKAVDKQPWDVSVKALTQFPDVLNQMASNLSWTSALGDAYFNIPQDVMNAVQVMRQRASQAGNLKSNAQQTISTEGAPPPAQAQSPAAPTIVQAPPQTIVIQPAQP